MDSKNIMIAILIMLSCAVGIGIGVYKTQNVYKLLIDESQEQVDDLTDKNKDLNTGLETMNNELYRIRKDNDTLRSDVIQLRDQLTKFEIEPDSFDMNQIILDILGSSWDDDFPPPEEEEGRGRGRGRNISEEERAEMDRRRQEGFQQMIDRRTDARNAELEKINDPEAWDRMAEITKFTDYNRDLAQTLRDAQTEEDRQEILQEMSDNQEYVNALQAEQRSSMLRDVAKEYGINNPAQQQSFIDAIQETTGSSIYRGGGGFGGSSFIGRSGPGGGGRGGR